MKILYRCCCGVDVHKTMIMACLLKIATGEEPERIEIRRFGTTKSELVQFVQWLREAGCTHIAMESTGVYWRPIFNLLEDSFEQILLVNAQHIKAVPGRKTDIKDAQWIAELLQHGLLRASFIPPRAQRELRELTRGRKQWVEERTRVINRLHKTLEDTNIKLTSVVSDLQGKSAQEMLWALVEGREIHEIARMGRGLLRKKVPELEQALQGEVREHHRFLLREYLTHMQHLDAQIEKFDREIALRIGQEPQSQSSQEDQQEPEADCLQKEPEKREPSVAQEGAQGETVSKPKKSKNLKRATRKAKAQQAIPCAAGYEGYAHAVQRLDEITGISPRLAQVLVSEIGIDMDRFASAEHLASWVGICPGNKISAGKRLSGKTTKGNTYARNGLIEAAQSLSRSKGTFLGALYQRFKTRLGPKRAAIAVAHRILVILYHMLKKDEAYQDYGAQVTEERVQEVRKQRALRELKKQGYTVSLEGAASA